jgi:hypothetical protein
MGSSGGLLVTFVILLNFTIGNPWPRPFCWLRIALPPRLAPFLSISSFTYLTSSIRPLSTTVRLDWLLAKTEHQLYLAANPSTAPSLTLNIIHRIPSSYFSIHSEPTKDANSARLNSTYPLSKTLSVASSNFP